MSSEPIRVAVAGAAGRMGSAVCDAVSGAPDMTLAGRADPALGTSLADVLPGADVVVDFTQPDTALDNALQCVRAGVHVVIGTTGFDVEQLRGAERRERLRGAQLRDRGGADDAIRHRGGAALPARGDHRAAP